MPSPDGFELGNFHSNSLNGIYERRESEEYLTSGSDGIQYKTYWKLGSTTENQQLFMYWLPGRQSWAVCPKIDEVLGHSLWEQVRRNISDRAVAFFQPNGNTWLEQLKDGRYALHEQGTICYNALSRQQVEEKARGTKKGIPATPARRVAVGIAQTPVNVGIPATPPSQLKRQPTTAQPAPTTPPAALSGPGSRAPVSPEAAPSSHKSSKQPMTPTKRVAPPSQRSSTPTTPPKRVPTSGSSAPVTPPMGPSKRLRTGIYAQMAEEEQLPR
mmetsp:Transcript_15616/g.36872  ORF Transcript_15616/g.36872 Transcript_15616/m.36872 type:complete len:271 (+) Transcript_15616:83-895(+)